MTAEPLASGEPNGSGSIEQKPGVMAAPRPTRFSKARQKTLLDLHEELLAILTLLERE